MAGNYIYGKEVVGLQALDALNTESDVLVVASGWNDGAFVKALEEKNLAYRIIKLGWIYITKPLWTLDSLIHLPGAWASFLKIRNRFLPDIIYTDSYRNVILLWPFLKKKSVVIHIHDEHAGIARDRSFIQKTAPKIKKYIAVSEFIKRDLQQCGIPANDIDVVYNAISDVPAYNKSYMQDGVLRIGIVGQILEKKGHSDLIAALIERKNRINFHLYIFGTGDEVFIARLKEQIRIAGIDRSVTWRGYVPEKIDVYKDLDIVVTPSRIEPFGLVAAEAGMHYCPVIVSDAGGLPEIVENGVTGYVFPKENIAALGDILEEIGDADKLEKMGNAGRKRIERFFGEVVFKKQVLASIIKKNFNV